MKLHTPEECLAMGCRRCRLRYRCHRAHCVNCHHLLLCRCGAMQSHPKPKQIRVFEFIELEGKTSAAAGRAMNLSPDKIDRVIQSLYHTWPHLADGTMWRCRKCGEVLHCGRCGQRPIIVTPRQRAAFRLVRLRRTPAEISCAMGIDGNSLSRLLRRLFDHVCDPSDPSTMLAVRQEWGDLPPDEPAQWVAAQPDTLEHVMRESVHAAYRRKILWPDNMEDETCGGIARRRELEGRGDEILAGGQNWKRRFFMRKFYPFTAQRLTGGRDAAETKSM